MTLLEKANTALQEKILAKAEEMFGSREYFREPEGNRLKIKDTRYTLIFEGDYFRVVRGEFESLKLISCLEDLALAIVDIESRVPGFGEFDATKTQGMVGIIT